jgi:hypothetical protein
MAELQALLYADGNQSLLVVLQALDAAGKDGVVRHLFTGMNPQGTSVFGFKQPSAEEAAHDFLWRAHQRTPAKGEVVVFNRSHYEDVLVVRVHDLVPKAVWSKRYGLINDFEKMLVQNGTRILKFFLHISPEEQLSPLQAAARRPGAQLEDQRRRLLRARALVRLRHRLRRGAEQDQQQGGSVVRHSGQPQVVPQSRHLADHRRHHGRNGAQAAADAGRPAGNRREVSRGRGGAGDSGKGKACGKNEARRQGVVAAACRGTQRHPAGRSRFRPPSGRAHRDCEGTMTQDSEGQGLRLPVFQGVLPVDPSGLGRDILAGFTLAALAIPGTMGYTKIIGTPVITGLYTILIPMSLFAIFGSSRHLSVGADSATAAVVAAGLAGMAVRGSTSGWRCAACWR